MWMLLTGKTRACYTEAMSYVSRCLPGYKLNIRFAGCDFEEAFFESVKAVLSPLRAIGCFFHFKQANRRKMIEYGLCKSVMSALLSMLDYAPSLPPHELETKGIPYLKWFTRKLLREKKCLKDIEPKSWSKFWKYFEL